ncbi:MAG: glycoside hydrolase family 5 protein [Lachnospiraceae bacterium]|nr:glycoside hydrolase family 5 protein [Lachnospiraceae bacterium]
MNKSVSANGQLKVSGIDLVNAKGEKIQLTGMSSHGLQWYPEHTKKEAIAFTKAHGASLFRVAMYTDEDGYIVHPELNKKNLIEAVDAAIELDMYVIIDWHILLEKSPLVYKEQAKAFFDEISHHYSGVPNVIYEICNEPNGEEVTWETDIRPYAEEIIPIIRKNHKEAVILVGTAQWSQYVDEAAKHPLEDDNVMYVSHFYAGSHGDELRQRIDTAREKGCAVFMSEWGTTTADGKGDTVYKKETEEWLRFMDERNMSWANWSLGSRDETSAALKPDTKGGEYDESVLTESGKFVFTLFH